ncbi:hypothetical protein [Dactylosporangium maewongense]
MEIRLAPVVAANAAVSNAPKRRRKIFMADSLATAAQAPPKNGSMRR